MERGNTMTKSELISQLAEKANLKERVARIIVETVFDGMKQSLIRGERIEIRGFGSFVVRNYRGYSGRNPKNGKFVNVRPKKLPFFKVGKPLKERINSLT
jgi:integration host factor subunit beta